MANYVETLLIDEGESAFNTRTFLQSDGAAGELTDKSIISGTELTPALVSGQFMSIWEIWYSLTNFSVKLSWMVNGSAVPFWTLTPSTDSRMKLHRFGGLIDYSGTTSDRKLVMSTKGFTAATSYGSFVLRMRKHANTVTAPVVVGN